MDSVHEENPSVDHGYQSDEAELDSNGQTDDLEWNICEGDIFV